MSLRRILKDRKKRWYFDHADVHLLSFPKSGRTWVRLMIGSVIARHFGVTARNPIQLHKLASRRRGIPCILSTHDCRSSPDADGKLQLERDKSHFAGKRVLLLVRDPRDVTISNYYGRKYRARKVDDSLSEFLRHPVWGVEAVLNYYNIWARNREVPAELLVIRYEDLRSDPVAEFQRVLEFVGLADIESDVIRQVVDEFEFTKVQKREREGEYREGTFSSTKADDGRTYKARSGKIAGYLDELDGRDLEYVNELVDTRLDDFFADYKTPRQP
jgi:hypothetical protein